MLLIKTKESVKNTNVLGEAENETAALRTLKILKYETKKLREGLIKLVKKLNYLYGKKVIDPEKIISPTVSTSLPINEQIKSYKNFRNKFLRNKFKIISLIIKFSPTVEPIKPVEPVEPVVAAVSFEKFLPIIAIIGLIILILKKD